MCLSAAIFISSIQLLTTGSCILAIQLPFHWIAVNVGHKIKGDLGYRKVLSYREKYRALN